jgi:putative transposase
MVFTGTLNKELFAEYLKTFLKPCLAEDDILLLDNSSVHTSKLVKDTLAELQIKHLFLPRYSPDFNPIELFWAWMKSVLRKLKSRTHEKLEEAVAFALETVPSDYIANWYEHCGYIVNI